MAYIHTSLQKENSPEPITRDSRGTEIQLGLRVAYNYQGDVIIGTIKELKRNEWKAVRKGTGTSMWWSLKFELLIENEEGHISKVKNPNSFVLI